MKHRAHHLIVCIALAGMALLGADCGESGPTSRPASDVRLPAPAGDEAAGKTVKLAIEGMHCQGCVTAITGKVQILDGVREVHVSLQDKVASVTVDRPERVEPIIQAIDSLGYKATTAADSSVTATASATSH
ncbi:MAG TPA: heavy metal-associated domain-containing protein [Phycisphaerae bacterium]|nr:heavy metal-associated domain-containing protein [Phycisphaerae bacterium]